VELAAGAGLGLLALFMAIDLGYLGANLTKIPDGGWVPLAMGITIFTLLTTWSRGRALMRAGMAEGSIPLEVFTKSAHSSAGAWRARRSSWLRPPTACLRRCCTTSSTTRCCTIAW
jgi:K+ transporter